MRGVRGWVVVAAVVLAWPLLAADEKPADKGAKDKPAAKDKGDQGKTDKGEGKDKGNKDKPAEVKAKTVAAGNLAGRLESCEGKIKVSVKVGTQWRPVEVAPADDMKVRLANPPQGFDDKGKPKRYTQKELAELRGPDKKLPGYTGELGDLKHGQYVQLSLVKKAGQPKNRKDPAEIAEYEPRVSVIVILSEQSPP